MEFLCFRLGVSTIKKRPFLYVQKELDPPFLGPYEMKWTDHHGNIHVRNVARPEVVSKFYKHSNSVDVHNHLRQACLKLEKKWVTLDCWFRVTTTLIGMSVVDCFRLSKFHIFLPQGRVQNLIDEDLEDIDIGGTYTMLERHHANLINEIEETSTLIDTYREERDRRRQAQK